MSFLAGTVGRFISKRIGSKIGGSLFNNSVSSCDGYDQACGPCCFDRKEAGKKGMNVCGSDACKTSNLGGVNACQIINLSGTLDRAPTIKIDSEKNRIFLLYADGSPFVNEFPSFNLDYFYTALLLTLSGNNLELTISLNPIDKFTMKCTTKPELIARERYVGNILFLCDWILKCLVFGTFIDDTTGESASFDEPIRQQLGLIGYKSVIQLRNEASTNFSAYTGATWIEPDYINVNIVDNKIVPMIGMRCFALVDSDQDTWTQKFADWFTDNFDSITKIFPIYNELRELIVTLTVVKVLRHFEMDLYHGEDLAVKHLEMGKYLNHKFTDETYKYHVFELGPQQFISGGIVNNYSIKSQDTNERIINIKTATNNPIKVNIEAKTVLTALSELRLKMGSFVKMDKEDKIKDLALQFSQISKIDPSWLEFYSTDTLDNKLDINQNIPDLVYLRLNIQKTNETLMRIMMCRGLLVI